MYEQVLEELGSTRKRSQFVFPQLKALRRSATAKFYGLDGLAKAQAYWAHPVLRPRLKECVLLVLDVKSKTAHEIFGSPDDLKFRSCLSLFELASTDACFADALDRFYDGQRDELTVALVGERPNQ